MTNPLQYRTPGQQPSLFYMPDLPARRHHAARAISPGRRARSRRARPRCARSTWPPSAAGAQHAPYVDANTRSPIWRELRGNADWSSLHLYKVAEETPFAKLFPKTLQALEAADVVRVDGRPVELFFSRLKPGTHIPPHFGIANNRLTLHLPLIVPGDCAIRVGSEMHSWREGELFAFDDSFEHEAWNRSSEDRVVLIFESHHRTSAPGRAPGDRVRHRGARTLAEGTARSGLT